jgi:hypothetical protein
VGVADMLLERRAVASFRTANTADHQTDLERALACALGLNRRFDSGARTRPRRAR